MKSPLIDLKFEGEVSCGCTQVEKEQVKCRFSKTISMKETQEKKEKFMSTNYPESSE